MARVLLADSQPLFNEALEALLTSGGEHEVVGRGSDPDEVVAIAGSRRPDLLLVDAAIGLGSPPNVVSRVLDEKPDTKVLVLGDDQDGALLSAAILAGAAGVVAKTYGAATVLRVAAAALDGEGVVPRRMLLDLTRRLAASQASTSPLARLSPRERQVLGLLSHGWDNARIGEELFISQHTVRTHIQNILEKLGMHSKLEVAAFALQQSKLLPMGTRPDP